MFTPNAIGVSTSRGKPGVQEIALKRDWSVDRALVSHHVEASRLELGLQ